MTVIRKLLIANRGEIACRIIRTARERGLRTVAVYSDADVSARHVRCADEAIHIGGAEPSQSYLRIDAIIEAAKISGADAIHPGYGFLSERADFSQACADAGIIFVGPLPDAISAMGDKAQSKRLMIEAGVPTIPGYQGDAQDDDTLLAEAPKIGFPLMVKASAGGGGRGMRIVERVEDLSEAVISARKEAQSAFGDGRLLLERAVTGARHVEVQVFADAHGNCIHLGERDCSLQRRNQKVIEEAPSPVITAQKRDEMGKAAVKAAQSVNYRGAGTVEFLFDPARDEFYFLEMNTRLQVEHPVTELVTGLDLVAMQLDVAEGRPLAVEQDDITLNGWAMEVRLYAEDPANGFMPHSGRVRQWKPSSGARFDTGIDEGDTVTTFYDPMIAKVIVHGATRDEARGKLGNALRNTPLLGFAHNRDFLINLLKDETFANGDADTGYIERDLDRLAARRRPGGDAGLALVGAALADAPFDHELSGWNSRGGSAFPVQLVTSAQEAIRVDIGLNGNHVSASRDDHSAEIEILEKSASTINYRYNGAIMSAHYCRYENHVEIDCDGSWERYTDLTLVPAGDSAGGDDVVKSPMAGFVTSIKVCAGDAVSKGTTVATVEAMKMEHQLKASRDGVVEEVFAAEGEQVAIRAKIVALKAEE